MLDGAMTIGSEAAAHIIWRTPQWLAQIKLQATVAAMLERTPLNPAGQRRLKEIAEEMNRES
jgi:hypothetical protein